MKSFFPLAALAGACLIFSCQNNADGIDKLGKNLSDTTSISGLTGNEVKLVKTADINVKVNNVEQGTHAVAALAHEHGGTVYYQNFHATEGGRRELKVSDDSLLVISTFTPQAEMTVRVPSERLETFMIKASGLGYFTQSSQLKIDDKSLVYLENALQRELRENVLTRSPKRKVDSTLSVQTIQTGDEAIQKLIANKTIDADAAYSNVTLSLSQNAMVKKEMIANYLIEDYDLPFTARLSNALAKGWDSFLSFVIAISHLWMFILLALLLYFGYRFLLQGKKATV